MSELLLEYKNALMAIDCLETFVISLLLRIDGGYKIKKQIYDDVILLLKKESLILSSIMDRDIYATSKNLFNKSNEIINEIDRDDLINKRKNCEDF
jgi:hypothetical protein